MLHVLLMSQDAARIQQHKSLAFITILSLSNKICYISNVGTEFHT